MGHRRSLRFAPLSVRDPRPHRRLAGRIGIALAVLVGALIVTIEASNAPLSAVSLPSGFREDTVLSGLSQPTAVEFSPDGRVFVAEKSGLVKVFDGLADPTSSVFVDLRTQVHSYWDRGLLDIALPPGFPADPWVYLLYVHDAPIGGVAPTWGTAGATSDDCPTPPGPTTDGCVVSGRLSRVRASGNTAVGAEQVLIEDWCQQFPSHSVGSMVFGSDGALYVSGGEGASFALADYGQRGTPRNPCGDPPSGVGGSQVPPTAAGGALRAQDLRTSGDPVALSGSVIRVDPSTGAGWPSNPFASSPDANARRIVGYGFRNPFRIARRPGSDRLWVGDVGWNSWEEIDALDVAGPAPPDFGWPCYEGDLRQPAYDALDLSICEDLYAQGAAAVRPPMFRYPQSGQVVAGETCTLSGGSISGLAFGPTAGTNYPAFYRGALYFSDYSRQCIFVAPANASGDPDFSRLQSFVGDAAKPVDLQIGPGGDLFYVDHDGTVRRIVYTSGGNRPPIAVVTANPIGGPLPLTVHFDGTRSSDPDGQPLGYAWDLDGDGAYDDSSSSSPTFTYTVAVPVTVRLRVTDTLGLTNIASISISPGNSPPRPSIAQPTAATTWRVGDQISFSGGAADDEQGTLPSAALRWELVMHHCHDAGSCHEHPVQTFAGVSGGSFVAPDHEYPSHLELRLTATDSGGLVATTSVNLDPRTVVTTLVTQPPGLTLVLGSESHVTPVGVTTIAGSSATLSAPAFQVLGGQGYRFVSWSDGGSRSHDLVTDVPRTLTATYIADDATVVPGSGSVVEGSSGTSLVAVPVTLSVASPLTVTVPWSTIRPAGLPGSPADPVSDYLVASGTVTFLPGETAKTAVVRVVGDVIDEMDEYLLVAFSSPTNAKLGGFWGLGFGTIVDDDAPPAVVPGSGSVAEGSAGSTTVSVPVTLSAPSGRTVTAAWSTIRPTGLPGSPADPVSDYVAASGTVTFLPGETSKSVSVSVVGDVIDEVDEYVLVSFSSPMNATIGGFLGLGFGSIVDDD